METAIKLVAEGNVQGVGYRALVNQIARKLRLKGYVQNMHDGTVQILCQGEARSIETFKKEVNIKSKKQGPFHLHVDKIVETPIGVKEKLGFFYIDYGEEAKTPFEKTNLERLEIGSLILSDVRDNVDAVGEKVDGVGRKVCGVGEKVDNLREDTNKNFNTMDGKYGDIAKNIIKVDNNISQLMEELVKSNNNNTELIKSLVDKLDKVIK